MPSPQARSTDDRLVSVTDALGNRTNTVYDDLDRAVATWGPAPSSLLPSTGLPPAAENQALVPLSTQAYDEGLNGLATTYWDNVSLHGPPDAYTTTAPYKDWGSGGPSQLPGVTDNFSARFTGAIEVPADNKYDFQIVRDGRVRLWIDDELVVDEWDSGTATAEGAALELDEGLHRVTVEYAETTGSALVRLQWRYRTAIGTPDIWRFGSAGGVGG